MSSPAGQKRSANHLTTSPADAKKPKKGSITSFFGPPKAKTVEPKSTSSRSSSFNKQGWVTSLTSEQRELLQLEIDTLDESWLAQLKEELVAPEFLALKRFLQKEKQSGCNEWLAERYGPDEVIDWSLTSGTKTTSPLGTIQSPSASVDKLAYSGAKRSKSQAAELADVVTQPLELQDTDEFDDDTDALEALAATETAS
ncbi:hypothetical protein APSETT444_004554 [Aspergillus pseudonomiae]